LVGELTTLGLVEEGPATVNTGPGRPSPIVNTRPHGGAILAIELSVDSIAVATAGLGGHIYNQVRVARPRGRFSPEQTVQDVGRLAEPLLTSLPADTVLVGVGTGVVGVVRRTDGFVHLAPNLGWKDIPIGEMLAAELRVDAPVMVANEADLGALAESRRGAGVGVADLIYVSGEAGIGVGVVQGGKPMLGSHGYAGEAGHTLVNPKGHRCRCGAVGCWETEAGELALARLAGLPSDLAGQGLLDTTRQRADAGDPKTQRALAGVGHWLGIGIGNLVNLFNPELVLLGGFFHALFPYLDEAIVAGLSSQALAAPRATARIIRSGTGVDAPLIGAAELAISELIADPAGTIANRAAPLRV
jgi:predicted NBD/HSP70 family sugar kinase